MKVLDMLRRKYFRLLAYCVAWVFVLVFMTYNVIMPAAMETKTATYTVTVTDKVYTGGRTLYLVFSEDENGKPFVFENRDTIFRGKFNSSDVQQSIHVGATYRFTAVGYRIFYLNGWYPNIIKVELISEGEGE